AEAHPFVRAIFEPFNKIPTNIVRQSLDMTPGLNFAQRRFQARINGSPEERAKAWGLLGIGTTLYGAAELMYVNGMLTGDLPQDKDLHEAAYASGERNNTAKLTAKDGSTVRIPLKALGPYGLPFIITANLNQLKGKVGQGLYEHWVAGAALMISEA